MNYQMMTRTLAITSGKGGVGKTTITCNLASALGDAGKKVLILDGDLGMANVDLMYGVRAKGNLLDVVKGEASISSILTPLEKNVSLISGGSGLVEMQRLNIFERRTVINILQELDGKFDYLLIDTSPGLSESVLEFNAASEMSAVVINSDPTSFADAYALIKVLNKQYGENRFAIICNQVRSESEGMSVFNRFNEVTSKFLSVSLDYWGEVPFDQGVKQAIQKQRLILRQEPQAQAALAFNKISRNIDRNLGSFRQKGGIQFFWEQMVGAAS